MEKKSGITSEYQTVWIQIKANILSGLTKCLPDLDPNCLKSYQQTTLDGKELTHVEESSFLIVSPEHVVLSELLWSASVIVVICYTLTVVNCLLSMILKSNFN